ncbi:MAG: alpha-2-macroglobulin [Acidobacteria bacterium]|nr:alpha-2-macroglobulin [Acidobacteriota bacterium]
MFNSFADSLRPPQSDYERLKVAAERLYSESSYALAHELYLKADAMTLPPEEARWVDFRVADTLWRSQAGTQTADSTKFDQARQQLEALIRDIQREEDRDRVWAEVQESLGDFWWTRRNARNWNQAWPYYQQALDWWGGARDIELARQRYLKIVWTMAQPREVEPYYYYGYYGNVVPLEKLENVLRIAQTENDKAHAHYLIAMTIRGHGGDWDQRQRVPGEFEAALKPGKSTDWYDDALYNYAEWMENYGRIIELEGGQWRQEPDYVKALELYRRLTSEYTKGETRYYDQAQQQIENITKPVVGVSVSNIFLPDSEIQFHLNWRNVKKVDLTLYKVHLVNDIQLSGKKVEGDGWLPQLDLSGREILKTWSKGIEDKGDYKPGQEAIRLDRKLPMGAYVIEVKAVNLSARDLILVTDVSLVLKTSSHQALAYFCNALDGSPMASGTIKLWEAVWKENELLWREHTKQTNQDGIAVFDLTDPSLRTGMALYVTAAVNNRQVYNHAYSYGYSRDDQPWRVYAFTDRPAYRPGEQVQWKFVARRYNGSVYSTPANQSIEFEIRDPRGTKVKEETAALNAFGSAWGSLDLTESMPLGEYRVNFWDEGRSRHIGNATLFRLEEYKLPEFTVSVQTPEEDGKKKAFKLGEKVEVSVQADYYFGGPVASATVEVLVYQNPFYHWWYPPREFPWFYEDVSARYRYYGQQGQIIKRETLKTDATGKATLTFDTPRGAQQDFEYRIEARVTDASRRQIIGSGTVRVTRQRYYAYLHPKHYLYRPQDKVTVDTKALDANKQPVQVEGRVKLTRDYWYEIWIDPSGKEVKGDELKRLQERSKIFPPLPPPGGKPWQLKFRGYQHDDILTRTVKTNTDGEAEFTFTPEREGYYRIAWSSEDKGSAPIKAETTVWVATNATTELGYRHGGLEIIVDKDTFRTGQKAPVLLNVPTNDRYVLFSVEGEDLYSYQLVHLTGTVKLVEVPIEEKHVPNIFLSAAMVSDRQIFMDTEQVIVPPVEHFLKVEVKSDRQEYQPREEGTLTVTTRDHDGKPGAAEVSLGLVDDSVYYIQQDYAGDPRQFYYGDKRGQYVQTQSTFQQKSYAKLVEGAEKQLVDDFRRDEISETVAVGGGIGTGRGSGVGYGSGIGYGAGAARVGGGDRSATGRSVERLQLLAQLQRPPSAKAAEARESAAEPGQEPAVRVRTDFRSTVLWQPGVVTDGNGMVTVKVKFPDSLTTWKATARVATSGNQFGIATASTRTNQPLIVRLQAPRFFLVGDLVAVSAVINNNTDKAMVVSPALFAEGVVVSGLFRDGQPVKGEQGPVEVPANGEARVDWAVSVQQPGNAKLKVTARGGKYADAMEKTYIVYEHGIEKFVAKSGKLRGDDLTVKLDIPSERKPESTILTVQVTPSMAVMMLDALPYLIDYPYGCTEQTMSRFLPAAITAKMLQDLGLKPEAIMGKIFGGIEQQYVDKTQPKGKKDLRQLDDMVNQGLKRLYDFQHSDGGWGWWKEGDSDHFMTAYVVWGLTLARDANLDVRGNVLERGVEYLDKELVEEETSYDQQAWMLHALSAYHASSKPSGVSQFQAKAFENLWTNRDKLNAYTRALLALSAHHFNYADRAQTLVRNLENGVKVDRTPDISAILRGKQETSEAVIGTAHWGEDGIYWRWSDGGVEATSFALRALLMIDPQNKLIEPVTNWLVKNRRGAQWSNTRDTAITVLTLNDYLRTSGELKPELEYELLVNGQSIVTKKLTAEDVLSAPSQFAISPELISDGPNDIRIVRKSGRGPIYFAAQAKFFSLEEPITPVGNEIFVRRQYYKLVGRPTLLKGYIYDRLLLNDGESVTSGDRVETVITIEAKNNYEYLVFEDLKPAGLEAVQIRSGEPLYAQELKSGAVERKFGGDQESATDRTDLTGRSRWVYQELRDRKVALFIDKLPEGVWEIRYDMRAEVPGTFHALPVIGYAMYVPEIRGNGTEVRIYVEDKK